MLLSDSMFTSPWLELILISFNALILTSSVKAVIKISSLSTLIKPISSIDSKSTIDLWLLIVILGDSSKPWDCLLVNVIKLPNLPCIKVSPTSTSACSGDISW